MKAGLVKMDLGMQTMMIIGMSSVKVLMIVVPVCFTIYSFIWIKAFFKYRRHRGNFLRHISF